MKSVTTAHEMPES